MANKKISELTALTTLAAADEFVVVDDDAGVTKRITAANVAAFPANVIVPDAGTIGSATDVDAMAIASTGVVTFSQGIKMAASKGIDFSAYGSGTDIDSNLLDDYEEGTWDPIYTFGTSGTVTLSGAAGFYTKIGNVVHASFRIRTDSISSPTGDVSISGLPFNTNSASNYRSAAALGIARDFNTDMPNLRLAVDNNTAQITPLKNATNASGSVLDGSDFVGGSEKNTIVGSLTYHTS